MSKLHDLIGKVENAELRAALADECRKLEKGKRFGLVFEEHLPEATPIPGAAIKVGATVATKAQDGGALFRVVSIEGDVAKCAPVGGDGAGRDGLCPVRGAGRDGLCPVRGAGRDGLCPVRGAGRDGLCPVRGAGRDGLCPVRGAGRDGLCPVRGAGRDGLCPVRGAGRDGLCPVRGAGRDGLCPVRGAGRDGLCPVCGRDGARPSQLATFPLAELVVVAKFGEPIYPYLEKLDELEHGGGDLWHALIQADNYHALQLLEYLYAGQVDCIYIDPPYNTGAKDWKYNNDYVDSNDCYRHSKWLSMMERRLKIAKRLLNPRDSVLIVTIDEKEYLHLGMLLEQMFPEARIQMVSDVINPRGTTRDGQFSRSDEYLYIVQLGVNTVFYPKRQEKHYVEWYRLRRTDYESRRGTVKGGTQQFYPIYIDVATEKIVKIGKPLTPTERREDVPIVDGAIPVFPIKNDGTEMNWGVTPDTLQRLMEHHFVRVRKNGDKNQPYLLHYISYKMIDAINEGRASIEGYNEDGTAIVVEEEGHVIRPGTAWNIPTHNAGTYGSEIIAQVIGEKRFTFPKSIYSVLDDLRYFTSGKPNALILDFFAGSGTTLHAVNLLNAEDGGKRRCILVTNNEVSNDEAAAFRKRGLNPGDAEWEARGIAQYVTWPRTTCSIRGVNVKGEPLKGEYITAKGGVGGGRGATALPAGGSGEGVPMADGFKANAVFFKLGFLDPGAVSMGRRFKELLPLLWMKAGAVGKCPACGDGGQYRIWSENRMAVLFDEGAFATFAREVKAQPEIATVYLITDYEPSFRAMAKSFPGRRVYQLYRDYRDNFRLNAR